MIFSREVQLDPINVTPASILTWLERLHAGVLGVTKVFGRMFVF
jgi:hypothetical protein